MQTKATSLCTPPSQTCNMHHSWLPMYLEGHRWYPMITIPILFQCQSEELHPCRGPAKQGGRKVESRMGVSRVDNRTALKLNIWRHTTFQVSSYIYSTTQVERSSNRSYLHQKFHKCKVIAGGYILCAEATALCRTSWENLWFYDVLWFESAPLVPWWSGADHEP